MGKLSNAKSLTKTERYSIQGMLNNGMDATAIAKALDRDEELVTEYVDSYNKEKTKVQTNINKTANGNRGVSIMTEATSQRVDGMRSQLSGKSKNHSAIHNIK